MVKFFFSILFADREKAERPVPGSTEASSRFQGLFNESLYIRVGWQCERAERQSTGRPARSHEGSVRRSGERALPSEDAARGGKGEVGPVGGTGDTQSPR